MDNHCATCKNRRSCYVEACSYDRWPQSLVDYFNSILKRDLCVNNGEDQYEPT
jgi:hypothetical protein